MALNINNNSVGAVTYNDQDVYCVQYDSNPVWWHRFTLCLECEEDGSTVQFIDHGNASSSVKWHAGDETHWDSREDHVYDTPKSCAEYDVIEVFSNTGMGVSATSYTSIKLTGKWRLTGSLIGLCGNRTDVPDYAWYSLFEGSTAEIDAADLDMDCTSIGTYSAAFMFQNCDGLTAAPVVHANPRTGCQGSFSDFLYGCTQVDRVIVDTTTAAVTLDVLNTFSDAMPMGCQVICPDARPYGDNVVALEYDGTGSRVACRDDMEATYGWLDTDDWTFTDRDAETIIMLTTGDGSSDVKLVHAAGGKVSKVYVDGDDVTADCTIANGSISYAFGDEAEHEVMLEMTGALAAEFLKQCPAHRIVDMKTYTTGNTGNSLFRECANVEKITLPDSGMFCSHFGTTFYGCNALQRIRNIDKITLDPANMNYYSIHMVFQDTWNLRLDDSFATYMNNIGDALSKTASNYTVSLNSMFYNCGRNVTTGDVVTLDLSTWDVSHANSMASMFNTTGPKIRITGLTNWDVSNVTNMYAAFMNNYFDFSYQLRDWTFNANVSMGAFISSYNPDEDNAYKTIDLSGWGTVGTNVAQLITMPTGVQCDFHVLFGANFSVPANANTTRMLFNTVQTYTMHVYYPASLSQDMKTLITSFASTYIVMHEVA